MSALNLDGVKKVTFFKSDLLVACSLPKRDRILVLASTYLIGFVDIPEDEFKV